VLVLHSNVRRPQRLPKRVQSRPWVTAAPAGGAVKLHGPELPGRVNGEVAGGNQRVYAHSSTHDVVTDSVNKRVRSLRFS